MIVHPHILSNSILHIFILITGGKKLSPRPGIEPGPSTWQAEILTTRLSRIVLEWSHRMFVHVKDILVDHVASWKSIHAKVSRRHAIGNMKNEKNLPILRAGFEPATYGYLMLTTTVHRSTNWAIEGGVAKHCISQDHIFSCVQLSVVVVVHKVIFWSVYNYLLLLLSPRADASSCTS